MIHSIIANNMLYLDVSENGGYPPACNFHGENCDKPSHFGGTEFSERHMLGWVKT